MLKKTELKLPRKRFRTTIRYQRTPITRMSDTGFPR
jgi:hypothetical protein